MPDIRHALFSHYEMLSTHIDTLEPSTVTSMYKEYKGASTFYPTIGIFFNEFALVYSVSMNRNK